MIGVDVQASAAVQMLDRLADRAGRPRPLLEALGDELHAYEQGAFASRGYGTWPANNPATVRAKGHGRVLVDTGGLLRGLTTGSLQITGDSVTLKTSHIGGVMAARGARGAPRRNPTPSPRPQDTHGWARMVLDTLTGA